MLLKASALIVAPEWQTESNVTCHFPFCNSQAPVSTSGKQLLTQLLHAVSCFGQGTVTQCSMRWALAEPRALEGKSHFYPISFHGVLLQIPT